MSITYEVFVDWNATDWTETPDYSQGIDNITAYVKNMAWDRGKKVEMGNIPAGILDITLENSDGRFSPPNTGSPLTGLIRPWLPVKVEATITGGGAVSVFNGFISRLKVDPHLDVQEAYMYVTDGMDFLARSLVSLDRSKRTFTSDGEAVGRLLDSAGWPTAKRSLDVDTGAFIAYPEVREF